SATALGSPAATSPDRWSGSTPYSASAANGSSGPSRTSCGSTGGSSSGPSISSISSAGSSSTGSSSSASPSSTSSSSIASTSSSSWSSSSSSSRSSSSTSSISSTALSSSTSSIGSIGSAGSTMSIGPSTPGPSKPGTSPGRPGGRPGPPPSGSPGGISFIASLLAGRSVCPSSQRCGIRDPRSSLIPAIVGAVDREQYEHPPRCFGDDHLVGMRRPPGVELLERHPPGVAAVGDDRLVGHVVEACQDLLTAEAHLGAAGQQLGETIDVGVLHVGVDTQLLERDHHRAGVGLLGEPEIGHRPLERGGVDVERVEQVGDGVAVRRLNGGVVEPELVERVGRVVRLVVALVLVVRGVAVVIVVVGGVERVRLVAEVVGIVRIVEVVQIVVEQVERIVLVVGIV